ncbi:MAG TPA: 50S ribosomal protein L9 [Candidatus Avanaerovorax faecigallinarum]|nr:50S ribosomal protein L9 [Candidatus Avanaerovorax faecigallinarum]
MIVILKKDIKGTGKAGDVVKVSDGYARNMLLPKGYAVEATDGNIRSLEKQKAVQAQKEADEKAAAEKLAAELAEKKIVIRTKAGEGGRLFGSITSKDIADAAEEQLGISIDKKKIQLNRTVKQTGHFDVEIKLYQGVKGTLSVDIVEE